MRPSLLDGEQIHVLDSLFPPETHDDVWIPDIGARGWVILTKDKAIQRRPNEIAALLAASTAVFVFSAGNVLGERIGLSLAVALPGIRKAVRRFTVPMLGRVNLAGEVSVAWDDGKKLDAPKHVKVRKTGHKGGG